MNSLPTMAPHVSSLVVISGEPIGDPSTRRAPRWSVPKGASSTSLRRRGIAADQIIPLTHGRA
ncbi:hypothetical protein I7I50_00023 [Histoplasma capsulatum G186AR]|uniref:Uncharacterized protein n=1 Tax=Ajellomyces capsulatus TaxID=5037 RepID=A0A8H7YDD2_AJECA|nr:hypothetical protein I7I52_07292 [Histoplasma capsulatum]QSS72232.1 hypothetical protein I7I50_00023 [Histoplasma capsulatum G186AR]